MIEMIDITPYKDLIISGKLHDCAVVSKISFVFQFRSSNFVE